MPTITARRAMERIARVCRPYVDPRALRLALIDELQNIVAFNAYAWLLTDPETEVGSAPLADVPCLPELPRLIRLKYATPVNRWTALDGSVGLLRAATADRPERSARWRDLLADYGVNDVASVVMRDRFGCWAFLDLWRVGARTFTQAEAEVLSQVADPITTALRRCQAHTFQPSTNASITAGPAVLVLSPELDVRAQTPDTEAYLRALVPPHADRRPIPAGAYNVAAQLLALEAGIDQHPAMTRVHLADGRWLTLRAARIGDAASLDADIAVTIEPTSPSDRLGLFARASGLSPRETELLTLLVAGADTREVAEHMYLSGHTIQDHLKSIFAKTETRNRRALVARATGS